MFITISPPYQGAIFARTHNLPCIFQVRQSLKPSDLELKMDNRRYRNSKSLILTSNRYKYQSRLSLYYEVLIGLGCPWKLKCKSSYQINFKISPSTIPFIVCLSQYMESLYLNINSLEIKILSHSVLCRCNNFNLFNFMELIYSKT